MSAFPRIWTGAVSGALTVFAFAVIHALLIVDIWFNIAPMLFTGALCGSALVWAYDAAVRDHSTRRWFAYNGVCVALLVTMGAASVVVLEPRYTIAGLTDNEDALALLLGHSWWLMVVGALVGTLLLWLRYGRRRSAIVPLLLSQSLLAFFVGHNFASLGLLEMSSQMVVAFAEFAALSVFLGLGFAVGVRLLNDVELRRRRLT